MASSVGVEGTQGGQAGTTPVGAQGRKKKPRALPRMSTTTPLSAGTRPSPSVPAAPAALPGPRFEVLEPAAGEPYLQLVLSFFGVHSCYNSSRCLLMRHGMVVLHFTQFVLLWHWCLSL